MMRILKESFQDVSDYLRSSELKDQVAENFPEIKSDPEDLETDICGYIVDLVEERFPDAEVTTSVVSIIKIVDDDSEVIAFEHPVIEFNGVLYDFTATQFKDSYSNLLNYNILPVTQQVVTNENQLNSGISSVKSYTMLKII